MLIGFAKMTNDSKSPSQAFLFVFYTSITTSK